MKLTDSVRNQIRFVQHHADELYKIAENGQNKAHWHAHEIAKGLGAISYILADMEKQAEEELNKTRHQFS